MSRRRPTGEPVRPTTALRQRAAPRATGRPVTAHTSARDSFMPSRSEGYVDHLSQWQMGQKSGSLLHPFRALNHALARSKLVQDPREPGHNPKRDHAEQVRDLSRESAERNTEGWLRTKGRARLRSASDRARLGHLASRPLSELESEIDGPLRVAIRRPRTSIGTRSTQWSAADRERFGPETSGSRSASDDAISNFQPVRIPSVPLPSGSAEILQRPVRDIVAANAQRSSNFAPRVWTSSVEPENDEVERDAFGQEVQGYVDKLYHVVTDKELDVRAKAVHNQYRDGFRSKIYHEKGGHIAKRLQMSNKIFHRQIDERQCRLKDQNRLSGLIFVVFVVFENGAWTRRPRKVVLQDILDSPRRYILISREQYDELGQGERDLYPEEWERLQREHTTVGETPRVLDLLKLRQITLAQMEAGTFTVEEFPTGEWLHFTSTRERAAANSKARSKDAGKHYVPNPTIHFKSSSQNSIRQNGSQQTVSDISTFDMTACTDSGSVNGLNTRAKMERDSTLPYRDTTSSPCSKQPNSEPDLRAEKEDDTNDDGRRQLNSSEGEERICEKNHVPGSSTGIEEALNVGEATETQVQADTTKVTMQEGGERPSKPRLLEDLGDDVLTEYILRTCTDQTVSEVAAAGNREELCDEQRAKMGSQTQLQDGLCSEENTNHYDPADLSCLSDGSDRANSPRSGQLPSPVCRKVYRAWNTLTADEQSHLLVNADGGAGFRPEFVGSTADIFGDTSHVFITVQDEDSMGRSGAKGDKATSVALELNGYDIRIRLALQDMLPSKMSPESGRVHSLKWLMRILNQLSEDKLLSDAGDLGAGLPRCRTPVFAKNWLARKFGRSKLCQQQLADVITTMHALETKHLEVRMYSNGLRERFNAGQMALLLNARSFAHAVSSAQGGIPLKFAQKMASFAIDFSTPGRLQKVHQKLAEKSNRTSLSVSGDDRCVLIDHLLSIILSGYGSAIRDFRIILRDEYDDLLHFMARGQPRDGENGRPLGSSVPFEIMSEFVAKHFKRDKAVFEKFFWHLHVREKSHLHPALPESTQTGLGDHTASSSRAGRQVAVDDGPAAPMMDLDSVIAIDDAVDLLGFDKRWDCFNATDACMLISQDNTALWAQHAINLENMSSCKPQYKAGIARLAKRTDREAQRREVSNTTSPVRLGSSDTNNFSLSAFMTTS